MTAFFTEIKIEALPYVYAKYICILHIDGILMRIQDKLYFILLVLEMNLITDEVQLLQEFTYLFKEINRLND
ncbi:hypothetical protein BJQ96_01858 [Flavobacterium sp. PL0002]|nr:hypothetical protein [Flavobacterium sp. PL002]